MLNRKLVVFLIGVGILMRLAAVLAFPVYPLVDNTADTEIYDAGARSLAAGHGYSWQGKATAFFPVGWPLLLSLAYRVAGVTSRVGQLLNLLLSIVLLLAGWGLSRRLYGPRVALGVALVLALAPHQVIYPAFLMSEVAFTAFFVAAAWALSGGTRAPARLILGGLLMGAATLIRGLTLIFPLAVLAVARFGERRSWRAALGATLVFGAAMLVPLAPWAARNHHVFGRWVLVANDGGMNFLMGNHHGATGARHEPAGGLPDTGDEVRDDREGYRRGLEFIRSHPLEFLTLLPRKLVRLVAPAPLLTYRAELLAKWPRPLSFLLLGLDQLLHVALWMVAAAGLWRAWGAWRVTRQRPRPPGPAGPGGSLALPLSLVGLWIVIHLAFLGGARYFFPMMPILVGLAMRSLGPGSGEKDSIGRGS